MRIFISYPSLDRETIRTLVNNLENIGHEVWSDLSLTGGQDWWERVLDGVRGCDLFVFGITYNWLSSQACLREFDYATTLGKNRLPVRLGDIPLESIPVQVRRLQITDYDNTDRSFLGLQRAINSFPPPIPLPTPLPDPPRSPLGELEAYDQHLRQMRLERDAQSAMVFELKQALRRRQSADRARQLLQNLRRHPDTTETVAKRIDLALSETDNGDKRDTLTLAQLAPLPDAPEMPPHKLITPENADDLVSKYEFIAHTDAVYAVAFSADGSLLASASGDKTVRLYNLIEGEALALLRGHQAAVRDVAFHPQGTHIASASADCTVRLWGIRQNRDIERLDAAEDWVLRVAFSPKGDTLAATSVSEMTALWDVEAQSAVATLGGHADWVTGAAFSPDGTTLATASYDRTVRLWNVARRRRVNVISDVGGMVEDIAYTPNGTMLAAALQDGTVRLWRVANQTHYQTIKAHDHTVYSVAFSPLGGLMATAGAGGDVSLWDLSTFDLCTSFQAHDGTTWKVAFSPDGGLIATSGEDAAVRVWALSDG
ncbi:MAG: TIR domain-containing protein [Chloroflexota bacterium]